MAISIQRGRQFAAGDATTPMFDAQGKAGTWLSKAADKLVAQQVTVTLKGDVTLATAADWKKFLTEHAASREATPKFTQTFGITFQDFVNVIDDAAAAPDTKFSLDLTPTSATAKALSLDTVENDYGKGLAKGATVNLSGVGGAVVTATSAGVPSIGPDILAAPGGDTWQRDRSEQESWADFARGNNSTRVFRENTGPAPFAKLTQPKWDDPEAMKLVEDFALPLHLEQRTPGNPDGTPRFQDNNEMFRDTYFEDKNGTMAKSGASVRARVRFDDDPPYPVRRVLVQAKEGRVVGDDRSAVRKFEKRFDGAGTSEEAAKNMLVTGREQNGQVLNVSQKLYQLAQGKAALPADGQLALEAKFLVLQRRRRTHLQLDSREEVVNRLDGAKAEAAKLTQAGQAVPPALTQFIAKVEEQLKFITAASAALQKYGQWMPSGECFIVSADRYSVYDPSARKEPPTDLDDEVGRIGEGPLHVEAEWDTASSDPFENALEEIDKQLKANPGNKAQLEADKAALEGMRETFRDDVGKTVELIKQRLVAAGLNEDTAKKSKDERAQDIADGPRPVFWV